MTAKVFHDLNNRHQFQRAFESAPMVAVNFDGMLQQSCAVIILSLVIPLVLVSIFQNVAQRRKQGWKIVVIFF